MYSSGIWTSSANCPGGFFADVAYAGSHGMHLPQTNQPIINQIPDTFINQAQQQFMAGQPVTIAQRVANYPFSMPLPGNLGPGHLIQGQLDRPFPEMECRESERLQLLLQQLQCAAGDRTKRFAGGGTLLVAYTYAKLISNTDTTTSWLEGGQTGGVGVHSGLE